MIDLIKKTMLTGIGLAVMTKDKVEDLSRELAKTGDLSEKARKELASQVEKQVKSTLQKLNIPTREEFLKLEKDINN